jgi:hypothetical protein
VFWFSGKSSIDGARGGAGTTSTSPKEQTEERRDYSIIEGDSEIDLYIHI